MTFDTILSVLSNAIQSGAQPDQHSLELMAQHIANAQLDDDQRDCLEAMLEQLTFNPERIRAELQATVCDSDNDTNTYQAALADWQLENYKLSSNQVEQIMRPAAVAHDPFQ